MKIPIRWVLVSGTIGLLFVTVAMILLSSYFTLESVLIGHARDIMENIASLTIEESENYLEKARQAAHFTERLSTSGVVNSKDKKTMEKYFLEHLSLYPHLSGMYYATPRGEFLFVMRSDNREVEGFRTKIISFTEGKRVTELIWRDGYHSEISREFDPDDTYDPRIRPWFIQSTSSLSTIWTDPYIFFTSRKPGLTTASPVLTSNGVIRGVVGVDIEIDKISEFLSQLQVGKNGSAFILNTNGDVVAFPDASKIVVPTDKSNLFRLPKIWELDHSLSRKAFASLDLHHNELAISQARFSVFEHEGERFHAMFTPMPDPQYPWIIGIYVPESDYLGVLKANRKQNMVFGILLTACFGVVGYLIARNISKAMRGLQAEANAVKNYDLDTTFEKHSFIQEIHKTLDAFSQMKKGLKEKTEKLLQMNEDMQREVAERKRAEKSAEYASKVKSRFLANMSHEIRTPLGGILGICQMLTEEDIPPAVQRDVEHIRNSANSLHTIINDILDLSKVEAGMMFIDALPFSIQKVMDSTIQLFQHRARKKEIDLDLTVSSRVPAKVQGDPHRLKQILSNLISNAVKFTDKGRVDVEVETLERAKSRCVVRFSVHDTGIGIPEEEHSELFQPFIQLDSSYAKKYEGTGLGLVIAAELTELMGGTIEFESKPGKGSTFMVTIPFRIASAPDASEEKDSARDRLACLPKTDILLVEDNPVNRLFLTRILTKAGHQVVVAENGESALKILERQGFDLVLMDVQMPKMDGVEVTKKIREGIKGISRDIPIIALTAYAMKGDRERFLNVGMDGYVTKPVNFDELCEVLENIIHKEKTE